MKLNPKRLLLVGLALIFGASTQAATLQINSNPLPLGTLPKNAVRVPFLQLHLTAEDGDLTIDTITIKRRGLSSSEDIGRVWAESSDYQRTLPRNFTNDDQLDLTFRQGLAINNGQTKTVTIYANLEFEGGGKTIQLDLVGVQHDGDQRQETSPETNTSASSDNKTIPRTKSVIPYDRTQYRIKCDNGQCRLVPRT